ncbi:MAG: UDP-N-acetylmuramate dehydrogenase [Alphaproteobacteria bacterium]|nr:UDP-N-acetylmuramate dehydrogenase [Alphaproteobacteria bacterium]
MMAAQNLDHLIDQLPKVRGTLTANAPIARLTWFRVGGNAEVLFDPADQDDLQSFLTALPLDIPVTILGGASNLIIRDGGISGVTIRLGRAFTDVAVDGSVVTASAAAMDITVSRKARNSEIGGLEFLSGIPGSIGGAVRMNAGAYETEINDVLIEATAIDRQGNLHRKTPAELGYTYRHCDAPEDWIFLSAQLQGQLGNADAISTRMEEIASARENSQPIRERTGGSTFKNPDDHKAWQLIDKAGCRGLQRGGAQVSNTHCNFLINTGTATAADLEGLGEEVRRRVEDETGIKLEWEIKRIGALPTVGGAS